MATEVINLRDLKQHRTLLPRVVRIDRRSIWGNPYRIGSPGPNGPMDRQEVLSLYRIYLARHLAFDPYFIEPLRGKVLACWCSPMPCHGDIIKEFLEKE